jgi:hypothetical protein
MFQRGPTMAVAVGDRPGMVGRGSAMVSRNAAA